MTSMNHMEDALRALIKEHNADGVVRLPQRGGSWRVVLSRSDQMDPVCKAVILPGGIVRTDLLVTA